MGCCQFPPHRYVTSYEVDGAKAEPDTIANDELAENLMEIGQGLLLVAVKIFTMQLGILCLRTGSDILTNSDPDSEMGCDPVVSRRVPLNESHWWSAAHRTVASPPPTTSGLPNEKEAAPTLPAVAF